MAASGCSRETIAAADSRLPRLRKAVELELECGDISSSQEDLLARATFLGGGGDQEDQATPPDDPKPRKPRVCTRKVRCGRTTTPDPLYMAVLMIPTPDAPPPPTADILELARSRGIFF